MFYLQYVSVNVQMRCPYSYAVGCNVHHLYGVQLYCVGLLFVEVLTLSSSPPSSLPSTPPSSPPSSLLPSLLPSLLSNQWLLDHEIDHLGLELTFSIESDAFGAATMVELIEGGSQIPVTDQNKVNSLLHLHLPTSCLISTSPPPPPTPPTHPSQTTTPHMLSRILCLVAHSACPQGEFEDVT